ncbi:ribbon-helix-helix protein, CopG family [Sphingomonas sp. SFZ2018-12]|uniref:ribbon-helix-helix protein, CopG family n=1 Tax=Sphingomonas sp. SFZ2018-12 TaxID=2683197 RepID=UPI001F0FA9F2|nr:ribbon-helix-helix protein, CopG family [Sphingomonas sp. SFZ2018-12]MCH4893917.1 ribbon-helix-helix protein, CopG family [Sphingomonas sp. SFZ2018-12]
MTRILADLPEEDIRWLDQRAAERGISRASLLRDVVATYKAQDQAPNDKAWLDQAIGIWKDRTDIGDAVEWQRRERASWTRPWDDDYEAVRAEFPDLFDETDDRERQRYLDMSASRTTGQKRSDR